MFSPHSNTIAQTFFFSSRTLGCGQRRNSSIEETFKRKIQEGVSTWSIILLLYSSEIGESLLPSSALLRKWPLGIERKGVGEIGRRWESCFRRGGGSVGYLRIAHTNTNEHASPNEIPKVGVRESENDGFGCFPPFCPSCRTL